MKLIKLSALLALALALTFSVTGCKKRPHNVTPLPNPYTGTPEDMGPATDNTGGMKPGEGVESGIPTATSWDPSDPAITQDRARFAGQTVYFALDSSIIRDSEHVKVESVIAAMQNEPSLLLLIEGHCDERGTEEYNRALGERRALALREELAKAGINPERIRTISYGEDKPAVEGHNEAAWSKNRRGVFVACTRQ